MIKILLLFSAIFVSAGSTVSAAITPVNSQTGFIENTGQIVDQYRVLRNDVKYIFQDHGFKMIFTSNGWSYELTRARKIKTKVEAVSKEEINDPEFDLDNDVQISSNRTDVRFINSNSSCEIEALDEFAPLFNFYNGNKMQSSTNIHQYEKIIYRNIYPLIDLVFQVGNKASNSQGILEYSFLIHPGGDPENIQLSYEGNSVVGVGNSGLEIEYSLGKIKESAPICFYQSKSEKAGGKLNKSGNIISLSIPNYDHRKEYIIDPTISYSTYFGGDSTDYAEDMEFDSEGNIIVCGRTASTSNIATSGAYDNTYNGGSYDMYLLKFNSSFELQWATYFGGEHVDYGWSVAIDGKDNIYLGGESYSDGLATAGAEQMTIEGSESDGLVAKFSTQGNLIWSRYFGGSDKDQVLSMAVDHAGRLIITGYSLSNDSIATAGAYQTVYSGNGDIFLAALDTGSGNAIWSTYYGSTKDDRGHHVAIDAHNQIYVSGTALSTTGIATAGTFHSTLAGFFDGYLAKFSPMGIPIWGTYVGGAFEDRGRDCVIDHAGNICMTGFTQSDTGVASQGTWKQFRTAGVDSTGYNTLESYVVKFDTNGHRLWGTYFGDTLSETARGIAIAQDDGIFITGATYSAHGIATPGAYQSNLGGISDAYYAKFDSTGNLDYSSYFGGSSEEQVGGYGLIIRTDDENNFYLCSSTLSSDSIAIAGAYQMLYAGGYDVFIAKFADTLLADATPAMEMAADGVSIITYPNPLKDHLYIRIETPENGNATIDIRTVEGKRVAYKPVTLISGKNEMYFVPGNISPGIYFVNISAVNFNSCVKIIVE